VAITVGEPKLVEHIFVEAHKAKVEPVVVHRPRATCKILLNERNRWRVENAIMQTDIQDAIADNGVFMFPHIADLALGKAQQFVVAQ